MRVANIRGRLKIITGGVAVDVEHEGAGLFRSDPQAIYERWSEFSDWAAGRSFREGEPFVEGECDAPVPDPSQVFAVGLNYGLHADEAGMETPDDALVVFTKFPSSIAGPFETVELPPGGDTDWEVELVAVIGRETRNVSASHAWACVAGLTVGQDLSERILQKAAKPPQFSLGKSYPKFGPTGPVVVTPDEFEDPDDLALWCGVNGESVQKGRTSEMLFSVPELIAYLSARVTLRPGDLVFTGTPSGVGAHADPPRFLAPGDELVSAVEGIGSMTTKFVAGR